MPRVALEAVITLMAMVEEEEEEEEEEVVTVATMAATRARSRQITRFVWPLLAAPAAESETAPMAAAAAEATIQPP